MKGFFFAVKLQMHFSVAQAADKELVGIAMQPVALNKALHVPYSFILCRIRNEEPRNTLSSYPSNQRGKILNIVNLLKSTSCAFFPLQPPRLKFQN